MRKHNIQLEVPLIIIWFVLIFVLSFFNAQVSISYADSRESFGLSIDTPETPDGAAKKAIESFTESSYFDRITENEAKLLGYKSKDEIKIAKPGPPFKVWIVGLKQLRDFKPGDDPEKLLENANLMLYPLMIGKEVRSSLTVTQSQKSRSWKTTQWNSGSLVRELWKYRTVSSNFVIWIPSLNLYFVADRAGGDLILIPITPYPVHGFEAGMRLPAKSVFSALKKEAEADTGGPR